MAKVSQAEFARLQGVNRSTVSRWVASGRVQIDEHGRIEVNPPAAPAEAPTPEKPPASTGSPSVANAASIGGAFASASLSQQISMRLRSSSADEREAKAELARMEVERTANALAERSEFDHVVRHFWRTVEAALAEFPRQVAVPIAEHMGDAAKIHATLSSAVEGLLAKVAREMHDAAKG